MAAFNVTLLEELGYDFESTQGFGNPESTEFSAVDFSAEAYEDDAKHSVVRSLGSLNAYQPATSLIAAQSSYYATDSNQQTTSSVAAPGTTSSVSPESAGAFFETSVTSEVMPGFEALPTVDLVSQLGLPSLLGRHAASPTWQTLARPTALPATTAAPSRE